MRLFTRGPGEHPGAAALLPVPAMDARAWQSRGQIHGAPGTEAVSAPAPSAVPQGWPARLHSSTSPGVKPVIFPALYFERGPLEHAPVSVVSDNQMPVPALDPRGTPAVMARRPVFLGQSQVSNPVVAAAYRNRAG